LIAFPNCKINIGLNILRQRSDGFHDLETIFYPILFYDVLEVIHSNHSNTKQEEFSFSSSGIRIETNNESNLCIKAYQLLKKDFSRLEGTLMHLHKNIPAGAGLGGGSADAAFALKLLNAIFDLKLTTEQLIDYAVSLGSDCPFFIINKPCFASGKGEVLEPVNIDLSRYKFILINPGIHIHTADAFSQITPALPSRSIKQIIQQPLTEWNNEIKNDFEGPVSKKYPEIKKIKDALYAAGAVYASMSGSGSTVYGIFEKEKKVGLSFPPHYLVSELHS
jgi:4-diphosphocytidyl-2-C-methyl-D-erythritol kinase